MSHAEAKRYVPDTHADTPRPNLFIVKEKHLDLGKTGSREFSYSLEAHHLSPFVMATDIAIAAKAPESFGFAPEDAGRAFLANPALVRKVAESNTKITSQIPGVTEKLIRERAKEVFATAQELMVLEKDQLESLRSMYPQKPDTDSTGRIFNEYAIKNRAQAMIAFNNKAEGSLDRPEDRVDLDVARGFDGKLLKKDDEQREGRKREERVDLPPAGIIFEAPRERAEERVLVGV